MIFLIILLKTLWLHARSVSNEYPKSLVCVKSKKENIPLYSPLVLWGVKEYTLQGYHEDLPLLAYTRIYLNNAP